MLVEHEFLAQFTEKRGEKELNSFNEAKLIAKSGAKEQNQHEIRVFFSSFVLASTKLLTVMVDGTRTTLRYRIHWRIGCNLMQWFAVAPPVKLKTIFISMCFTANDHC